jgi:uncharacterized cupredoxin-like copper-binding protein
MAAALLLPHPVVAQGGLILSNGIAPTSLYRVDLVSPGPNEGRFLFDFVNANIVHAIAICPGEDQVFAIGADRDVRPAVSIVQQLLDPVPTETLVGLLPLEFENAVFQLACRQDALTGDNEFFFTNLKNEVLYTIDPDTACVETAPDFFECTPVEIGPLRTDDGTLVDTHGADIEFTDDGTLYLVTNNINPATEIRDFYQVDPTTAIATLIKEDVTLQNNTGMGETIDGRLVISNVDDNLYQVDPATGNAVSLGPILVMNGSSPFVLDIIGGDMAGRAPGGSIVVRKETDPAGSAQSFEFEPIWDSNFSLADGEEKTFISLLPVEDGGGPYSVTEIVPAGWQLTSATCDDGSDPADIDLNDGELVTCTFFNTLDRGTIAVQKMTVPSGSSQTFEFQSTLKPNFMLADGGVNVTSDLMPSSAGGGPYSVSEVNIPAGWQLTSATCDDGSNPGDIDLDPGETVTCTFVNTLDVGQIMIHKIALGGPGTFPYTGDLGDFNLVFPGNDWQTFSDLQPGTYTVTELVPPEWDLTDLDCIDPTNDSTTQGPSAIIDLSPGESVECIWENTKRGQIIIQKDTEPEGGAGFGFTDNIAAPNAFALDDGQQEIFADVVTDATYLVIEDDPSPLGFELTDITCVDGDEGGSESTGDVATRTATIHLDPGEVVTCVFTNTTLPGTIIVEKQTDPNGSSQLFEFEPSWKANFTLMDDEQNVSTGLQPTSSRGKAKPIRGPGISYSVTEIVPADWALTSAICDDGSDPSAIELGPGETVTCVFTNTADVDECPPSIDFETDATGLIGLVPGEIIDDTNQPWAIEGIWLSTDNSPSRPLMIFDTSFPTGGDIDLGTPNELFTIPPDFIIPGPGRGAQGDSNQIPRGQVLIISEDGDSTDPDDSDIPGLMRFDFDPPVELTEIRILDVDENEAGGTATAYDDVGNVILTRPLLPLGDNSFQVVQFLRKDVSRLDINFVGSGALTAVIFCEDICILPPEPPEQ